METDNRDRRGEENQPNFQQAKQRQRIGKHWEVHGSQVRYRDVKRGRDFVNLVRQGRIRRIKN